jgi:hypothetical protein
MLQDINEENEVLEELNYAKHLYEEYKKGIRNIEIKNKSLGMDTSIINKSYLQSQIKSIGKEIYTLNESGLTEQEVQKLRQIYSNFLKLKELFEQLYGTLDNDTQIEPSIPPDSSTKLIDLEINRNRGIIKKARM